MTKPGVANKIAVIGATGNVGRKAVEQLLNKLHFPPEQIELYASPLSEGKLVIMAGREFTVHSAEECHFKHVQICLLATDNEISARYIPQALENNVFVIDSSSLHRLDADVPLIVAPVNRELVSVDKHHLYAIANCVASPISVVLASLHRTFPLRRVNIVTYQSASGAGKGPMDELKAETINLLEIKPYQRNHFPRQIAFNVIPMIGELREDGYTSEEFKIMMEINKIVGGDFVVTASCVRVPVMIGHSMSLAIEFQKQYDLEQVKNLLANAPGISFDAESYTTPVEAVDTDNVHTGRIHRDISVPFGLHLWLCSDNLRRGAATDAVEVIEEILRQLQGK